MSLRTPPALSGHAGCSGRASQEAGCSHGSQRKLTARCLFIRHTLECPPRAWPFSELQAELQACWMGPCPQEADLLMGEKGQSGRGHLIGTRPKPRQWGMEMGVPGGHSVHCMGLGRGRQAEGWGSGSDSGADGDVVFREGFTGGGRCFQDCGEVTGPRSVYLGCQWVKKSLN